MNINNELVKIVNHWDELFKTIEVKKVSKEDFPNDNPLSEAIIDLASKSETILDIGTGSGYALFTSAFHGTKFKKGLGIDPSLHAIKTLNEICEASNLKKLTFEIGDHNSLEQLKDASFDGIICSNVLDVLPEVITQSIIKSIKRLLKPGGLLILKLNFFLTPNLIERLKMEEVAPNTYAMNGIIRGLNYTSDHWVNWFKPLSLLEETTYERLKNGPKDRVLIFKKD
jgi:ubiquinone/menaquinone biosynthesis C-methylase UbiE